MKQDDTSEEAIPAKIGSAIRFSEKVPPAALLLVTVAAWTIYATVVWNYQWQSRLMHPLLFSTWTIAWHTTVRGSLARRLGLRMNFLASLIVPPVAALGGEAIQDVIPAVGHEAEWGGACFSLLGVAIGWALIGLWRFLGPVPRKFVNRGSK